MINPNYKKTQMFSIHFNRIAKIKPFINKYNWKGTNVPSEKDDWKKI